MLLGIHLTVYLLFQMIAVLLYKWGSTDPKYYWWGFVIGNIFSFASIFSFMYVHKGLHPNIALAVCTGGAFVICQTALYVFYKQALAPWQWCGLAVILGGILLVAFGGGMKVS